MFNYLKKILFATVCMGVGMACQQESDCHISYPSDQIILKFYNQTDSSELKVNMLELTALQSDSLFYKNDTLSTFHLALSPTLNEVTFVFYTYTAKDTLKVKYTKSLEWISMSCGLFYHYADLSIVATTFSSELASSHINRSINENIKIYY